MSSSSRPELPKSLPHTTKTGGTLEPVSKCKVNRTASILRKIYLRPGIGVGRMRHMYGGRDNRGNVREHHFKGAGKNIRTILQSLQEADLVMRLNDKRNKSYGRYLPEGDEELFTRVVTPEGQRSANEIAKAVFTKLISGDEEAQALAQAQAQPEAQAPEAQAE